MKHVLAVSAVILLSACGSDDTPPPRISPASGGDPRPTGMTYREYSSVHGDGSLESQKRFLMLDRNNNGHLSEEELGNFGDY